MDRAAAEQKTAELVAEYGSPDACPAALLCDRHPGEAVAFTVVEPDLSYRDLTFGELGELSARFAANLAALGVGPGDAVATLMGKSAELVVALLGIWRRGAVHVPLFTAFAPPAIEFRLARSGAKVVVADEDQRLLSPRRRRDHHGGLPHRAVRRRKRAGDSRPGHRAAVIGVPDELRGEVIEAFVVLRDPSRGSGKLAGELQQLVKDKFAAHAYPRRVHFVDALPKTPSGKVQRYLLRQQRAATATP